MKKTLFLLLIPCFLWGQQTVTQSQGITISNPALRDSAGIWVTNPAGKSILAPLLAPSSGTSGYWKRNLNAGESGTTSTANVNDTVKVKALHQTVGGFVDGTGGDLNLGGSGNVNIRSGAALKMNTTTVITSARALTNIVSLTPSVTSGQFGWLSRNANAGESGTISPATATDTVLANTYYVKNAANDFLKFNWSANVAYITTTATGRPLIVGTDNASALYLRAAGNNYWLVSNSGGHFLPNSNNTVDVGGASNRVRNIYLGNAIFTNAIADPAASAGQVWLSSTNADVLKYSNASSTFNVLSTKS